ncbi:MAG TPA: methyltransferase domain-containing protein [Terriglobales bacterium]|nr:methyltransferase domain-containing protein [Terriglobales bacterium]
MTASVAQHQKPEQCTPVVAESLLRINIGCGTTAPYGWYNIDNSPSIWLSRVPVARTLFRAPAWPRDVRCHNVLKGLPFGNESVDFIYSSHTFEHFTYAQSLEVSKECLRILKPGGILRIVVPDLGQIVRDYLADSAPLASHRFVERLILGHTWRDLLHPGAHHSQMFDARSLVAMLQEAGFEDPQQSVFGQSPIPGLMEVELESRRRESLYVEAQKATTSPNKIAIVKSS